MNIGLQIFNTDIIPVYTTDTGEKVVIGRELHEKLKIETPYGKWFSRMCDYGFVKNEDYVTEDKNVHRVDGTEMPQIQHDHILTLDMAKHIAMIQRTPQGMRIRQKLIELEKEVKLLIPQDYSSALRALADKVDENNKLKETNAQQQQLIEEQKPKVNYYDVILSSKDAVSITKIAKDYGKTAQWVNDFLHKQKVQFKQGNTWLLYKPYATQGYTKSETIPYDKYDGETGTAIHTKWTQKGRLFIYDLLKKHHVLPLIDIDNSIDNN